MTTGSYELHSDLHFGVVEGAAICVVGTYWHILYLLSDQWNAGADEVPF